ncbi:MAG: Glyoxylase [Gammaproteobacteria bacterium]|nr:Glyoxylase [Gammaproteobacteria bacterium]
MSKDMPKQGDFCWNELMTGDTQAAGKFYAELFGWECHTHQVGEVSYTMFKNGDKEIAGMMQTPDAQKEHIPPHWMSYVLVDDLDAMVEKAQSLGATIKVPAQLVGNFGRLAMIEDPTGAVIAFWQYVGDDKCDQA